MAGPKDKAWYKANMEGLTKVFNDAFVGLVTAGERMPGGSVWVDDVLRAAARITAERIKVEYPSAEKITSPLEAVHYYLGLHIRSGVINRESARAEAAPHGGVRVTVNTADCIYRPQCELLMARNSYCVCPRRFYMEQVAAALAEQELANAVVSLFQSGECTFEIVPAGSASLRKAGAEGRGRRGTRGKESARKDELSRLEAMYQLLLETIGDAIVVIDNEGKVSYMNPRACGVFGVPAGESIGAAFEVGGIFGRIGDLAVKAIQELGKWEGSAVIENADGANIHNIYLTRFSPIFGHDRSRLGTMVVLEDITNEELLRRKLASQAETLERMVRDKTRELQDANAKLEILARTDALTGLPNRRTFEEILRVELQRANRYKHSTGLLMVDVDDFKQVNDRLGHQTGDEVLKYVSTILAKSVRATDSVARWGGDEFILLLPQAGVAECQAVARRINENLLIEHAAGEVIQGLQISLSVGWATDATSDAEALVAQADKMMYDNKQANKSRALRDKSKQK